jgi:2Fe-2S ferredoxin
VYVAEEWRSKVGPAGEDEQDMIDLAFETCEASRLGCKLVLSQDLEGLRVHIPRDSKNLFDDIPFL